MKNNSRQLSYLEGWLSIVVNIGLFGLKYWVGIVTGSIAIIADAWHTLSDSTTSMIVIIGAKVSTKPADKQHPFGHGRAELIASLVIGVLLAIVAFKFFQESVARLIDKEVVTFGTFAIVTFIISTLVKEALAQFAFWASKKSGSKALRADAWHHRSDAIASFIILIGMFLGKYFWWMDGVLGVIVALLIGLASFEILRDSINPLLGKMPEERILQQVRSILYKQCGEEVTAHHFHLHEYGDHSELTFHIKLPKTKSLEEAHLIASCIEDTIRKETGIETTIHMEPIL